MSAPHPRLPNLISVCERPVIAEFAWLHQTRAFGQITAAIERGDKRIVYTAPTGAGKGRTIEDLLLWADANSMPAILYTERRLLFQQTANRLDAAGIRYGKRASGHEPDLGQRIQLAMIQTEFSQTIARERRFKHHAKLVIPDEGHKFTSPRAQKMIQAHLDEGAAVVYLTATPVGMSQIADVLIQPTCTSECRSVGALVYADYFAFEEIDSTAMSAPPGEDFSETELAKMFTADRLIGYVYPHWKQLNPDGYPTILFGPSVAGAMWFAELFHARGVSSAHIDADTVWVNGTAYPSNDETREQLMADIKSGQVTLLTNRFVAREGWDCPQLRVGILATAFGALSTYLQSVGRLLRACPGKDRAVIQDHGGHWWRHGSPNADRVWSLEDTNRSLAVERRDLLQKQNADPESHVGEDGEPILCPKCHRPRRVIIGEDNAECPFCGYRSSAKSRYVLQVNGNLRRMTGDIFVEPKRDMRPDDEKKWRQVYYAAKNSKQGMTFRQAEGYFHKKFGFWPRQNMPLMPESSLDWDRKVRDVPRDLLIPEPPRPQPTPSQQQRTLVT